MTTIRDFFTPLRSITLKTGQLNQQKLVSGIYQEMSTPLAATISHLEALEQDRDVVSVLNSLKEAQQRFFTDERAAKEDPTQLIRHAVLFGPSDYVRGIPILGVGKTVIRSDGKVSVYEDLKKTMTTLDKSLRRKSFAPTATGKKCRAMRSELAALRKEIERVRAENAPRILLHYTKETITQLLSCKGLEIDEVLKSELQWMQSLDKEQLQTKSECLKAHERIDVIKNKMLALSRGQKSKKAEALMIQASVLKKKEIDFYEQKPVRLTRTDKVLRATRTVCNTTSGLLLASLIPMGVTALFFPPAATVLVPMMIGVTGLAVTLSVVGSGTTVFSMIRNAARGRAPTRDQIKEVGVTLAFMAASIGVAVAPVAMAGRAIWHLVRNIGGGLKAIKEVKSITKSEAMPRQAPVEKGEQVARRKERAACIEMPAVQPKASEVYHPKERPVRPDKETIQSAEQAFVRESVIVGGTVKSAVDPIRQAAQKYFRAESRDKKEVCLSDMLSAIEMAQEKLKACPKKQEQLAHLHQVVQDVKQVLDEPERLEALHDQLKSHEFFMSLGAGVG
jgi:hypothetical protein